MRIAMVVWEYPPHVVGGLGTYSGAMAPALRAAGHDVQVFAALRDGDAPEERPDTHWARQLDLSPTYLGVYNQEASSWGAFFGELYSTNILWADAVRAEHDRDPFDVIAVHDWLGAPAGLTLARHVDTPIVLHVHSAEWGRQPGGPSPIVSQWETAAGRAAAATITVSQAMVRDLIAHGWEAERVHGVWNGVDTDKFSPDAPGGPELRARYGLPDEAPVVFFIGRLTGVKGARPLIEGWPRVVDQHPEARLVALGTGDQDEEIRGLVAGLGVEDSVTLRTEWVSEAERIAHFAAADLVVLPSTYEPFGIVCLEAMACGKPVVVGARGVVGFREQVLNYGPHQCGVHVNGADAADIAWGLDEALSDQERMQCWGRNGRRRAETMFTWERCAARTVEVYGRVARPTG